MAGEVFEFLALKTDTGRGMPRLQGDGVPSQPTRFYTFSTANHPRSVSEGIELIGVQPTPSTALGWADEPSALPEGRKISAP